VRTPTEHPPYLYCTCCACCQCVKHDDVSTISPNLVRDAQILGFCHLSALACDLLSRMGVYAAISWKIGTHKSLVDELGTFCWEVPLEYGFEVLV